MQCVARMEVCYKRVCGVLQCAALCCTMLQCAAVCCSVLQVCCSVLQCVAVCCKCVAVWRVLHLRQEDKGSSHVNVFTMSASHTSKRQSTNVFKMSASHTSKRHIEKRHRNVFAV